MTVDEERNETDNPAGGGERAPEAERQSEQLEATVPDVPADQPNPSDEAGPAAPDDAAHEEGLVEEDIFDATESKPEPTPELTESQLRELDERRAKLPWYAVHTYSGYEMRAKLSLEERIKAHSLTAKFGNILVPQETVVELVRGQKKTSTRKFLPGYILVQVDLDDETWHLVAETPKVSGFVGDSRNPSPLTSEEVQNLTRQMEGGAARPRPRVKFEEGDAVKVIDGPFADFNGTVDEVKADKGKLRVLISIFGRNTPVELDFVQVEKV